MINEKDNPYAFPFIEPAEINMSATPGITLLDHFAGLAMQGMMTYHDTFSSDHRAEAARQSSAIAAAMLEERKKYLK